MILSNLKIRMQRDFETLKKNNVYPVKFETDKHYVIFNDNVYIHIYKDSAEIVRYTEDELSGQLKFVL